MIWKLNEKCDFYVHKEKVNSIKGLNFLNWEEIQKNHAQSEVVVKVNRYENCIFESLNTILVYTNTANSLTEKLISTVLDFDIKGNLLSCNPEQKLSR